MVTSPKAQYKSDDSSPDVKRALIASSAYINYHEKQVNLFEKIHSKFWNIIQIYCTIIKIMFN